MGSSKKTAWNIDLDGLVPFYGVYRPFGKQIMSVPCSTKDLQQDRDSGGFVDDTINAETGGLRIESEVEIESLISAVRTGFSRNGNWL